MLGLAFSLFAYLSFNLVSLALVFFLADFLLPHSINHGPWSGAPLLQALLVNGGLLLLFGLQHSVMARPGFKQRLQNLVPAYLERSLYVLLSSLAILLLIMLWHPIAGDVWRVTHPVAVYALWGLFALGWALVVGSTHLIDHYELFGLAQVWRHRAGTTAPAADFRTPSLYRFVRHPLYTGFLLAFWATPVMTAGQLFFAAGMTLYILIGVAHEERDLIRLFGDRYRDYRGRVPALLPNPFAKS